MPVEGSPQGTVRATVGPGQCGMSGLSGMSWDLGSSDLLPAAVTVVGLQQPPTFVCVCGSITSSKFELGLGAAIAILMITYY